MQTDYDGFEDDVEAAENSSSNMTEVFEQLLLVYKEYGFVPQNKTLDDLFEYLEDLYYENEELIEEYHDTYGFGNTSAEYHLLCHIHGKVKYSFYCMRIPILFTYIDSPNGGWLQWFSWGDLENGFESYNGHNYMWEANIFLGVWFPFVHNGWNIIGKWFIGFAVELYFDIS